MRVSARAFYFQSRRQPVWPGSPRRHAQGPSDKRQLLMFSGQTLREQRRTMQLKNLRNLTEAVNTNGQARSNSIAALSFTVGCCATHNLKYCLAVGQSFWLIASLPRKMLIRKRTVSRLRSRASRSSGVLIRVRSALSKTLRARSIYSSCRCVKLPSRTR
jgi:hypothetical protein